MTHDRSPLPHTSVPPHEARDALQSRVATLSKAGFCTSPSWSPDGSRLAFVSDLGGLPQVWTVAGEGGWPRAVTALDDQVQAVAWSPSGDWLAVTVAPGGGMNSQLYVVRSDGTGWRRLSLGERDNNLGARWTRDGRHLTVTSNRDRPDSLDAYLVDPHGGEWHPAARTGGLGFLTDVGRDGRLAVLYRMVNRGYSDLDLVDLATGHTTPLTPHEGPGSFGVGQFSPDGRTVYLTSDKDRELAAFARVRLGAEGASGEIEVLAERDDAECAGAVFTRDGARAALLWNAAGRSELELLDLQSGARTPVTLPSEIVAAAEFSPDGRQLALALSGSQRPPDLWVLDVWAGTWRQVTFSPHAGVDLDALVRPELLGWRSFDGLPLSGWLYLPPGFARPGPLVLSFHGAPESQERPSFRRDYQALLSQGVAVFAPNVRGSSGFGKTFVNLDNGALRVNAVRDIQACADHVVGAGIADARRLGIMGGSYGGYMTMAGLTTYPDLFAAGANLYGVVNFETFFQHTEPWMAAISKVEYGDPDTQRDLLRALSPIHQLERVRAPVIVLHGANDTNVPVREAEQVVHGLRARGVPVQYLLFPDEGHGFSKTHNRVAADTAVSTFFARHLAAGVTSNEPLQVRPTQEDV